MSSQPLHRTTLEFGLGRNTSGKVKKLLFCRDSLFIISLVTEHLIAVLCFTQQIKMTCASREELYLYSYCSKAIRKNNIGARCSVRYYKCKKMSKNTFYSSMDKPNSRIYFLELIYEIGHSLYLENSKLICYSSAYKSYQSGILHHPQRSIE